MSDLDFHLVKVYNQMNGKFLYEFGRNDAALVTLIEPTGIAIDKTGHLLVCCGEAGTAHPYMCTPWTENL